MTIVGSQVRDLGICVPQTLCPASLDFHSSYIVEVAVMATGLLRTNSEQATKGDTQLTEEPLSGLLLKPSQSMRKRSFAEYSVKLNCFGPKRSNCGYLCYESRGSETM